MSNNNVIKLSIVVLVLSNVSNFFQYLSQLILGRTLSPEAFGIFNSINSLSVLGSSLTVFISFTSAHEYIKLGPFGEMHVLFVRELIKKILFAGVAVSLFAAAFSCCIARFLGLNSVVPVFIYILILLGILLQAAFTGVLQGMSRYAIMSAGQSIQMGARLIFIVIAVVLLELSYNGALVGVFFSYVVVTAFYLYYLSDVIFVPVPSAQLPPGSFRKMLAGSVHVAFMWAYLGIISNIDIPLVKHYSPEYDAGLYSGGAIIGRIVWFFSGMLVYVLFPEVVRSESEGKSSVAKTLQVVIIVFFLSFGLAGFFSVFSESVLTLLLGRKYGEAKQVLVIVSFSMALLAMLSVLYNYFLAKKQTFFLYPAYLILAACCVIIYTKYHARPIEIATVFLVGLAITLIITMTQFIVKYRWEIASHVAKLYHEKRSFWSAE